MKPRLFDRTLIFTYLLVFILIKNIPVAITIAVNKMM